MGPLDETAGHGRSGLLVPVHAGEPPAVDRAVARDIEAVGAACRSGVIDERQIEELRGFVDRALAADQEWHAPDDPENDGRVTFLPRYGTLPLSLLDHDGVMGPVCEVLGDDAEMYTMTTACQGPGGSGRAMHVDAKHPPGYILGLGALILLDDFTDASGPTRFHPEMVHDQPTLEDFESRALRLVAPAGSVCWFNAGAWHDVLPNRGGAWRRAVLIAMGRAGIRPRFDVPRMLSHLDLDHLPERVCRRLGLLTIPPGSYEEYYLPDGARQEAILRRALDRC